MKKVFDLIKNRYFLYPLMGVTFLFNFVGLVCRSVEDGFEAALLFEILILGVMYFFLIYSLRKNHYRAFTALVLMIFTYDSIYFVSESIIAVSEAIHEADVHHALAISCDVVQLLASLFAFFALIIYFLETYTSYENEKLFTYGKIFHLIAAVICIFVFILRCIYTGLAHENIADICYTVSYTFAPLAVLSLSLNVQNE